MNILNIEKVTKEYGNRTLLNEVTLGISSGDKIGLIGVNGTGKSTFLKIVAGLVTPDEGQIVKGNQVTVSYLPQNPVFEKDERIIDYVVQGATNVAASFNSGGNELHEEYDVLVSEAKSILNQLGITNLEADISKLSGGQRKRIALAKTLIRPATLLVMDEPTNHLDNEMVIWLENYIVKFRGQLLMVTHDRYFLDRVTNRIVEIDKGNLYSYATNYSGFLTLKAEREEMEAATENKRQNMLRTELAWIQRGCQARSTKQQARIDRYSDMKEASRAARQSFDKQTLEVSSISTRLGKKTVELSNICKSYGTQKLIDDFTYIFLRDDRIGIVGSNGCGKSTLMKIITGELAPDSGTVSIGETVKIGFFKQENVFDNETVTVIEHVKGIGEYVATVDGRISASQMCEKFLFTPQMQWTPLNKLSGGEKRRLYLLSVLMASPNVLILDEPTNDLDIETLEILEDYIDQFAGIIITVSHDRYFLDRIADRIFAFEGNGKLRQYEGGFTDYYEKHMEEIGAAQADIGGGSTASGKNTDSSGSTGKGKREHSKKLKFSYQEQKEYDTIDADIEQLETKLTELDVQIAAAATQYSKLNELMEEKANVESQLEHKMERWVYLNDLAEQIANEG